ncbi:MAG: Sugar O-acyltransferase, sialic acid O-acetyltransferase NeuD family [Candidatus Gottesmanbacteria bacterium GW2011_GWB1_49_7]|uniref:Sugar O-acyltransferase, sialic acid O-acetyltransferase NeuD family n=1 Tax=Candidatus Gottesmanbacteria bacterium GW2011_GWB1_49_7 TaxID=1618448 RepID=A0A0G1W3I3_9BACT|nr:MAG: Sugar O-acyltransferase, sialic acid O-acetyltransferase NeuD family [Candidatus Gottesmanbacteria bacterium GW2011_GWB1_49_7]
MSVAEVIRTARVRLGLSVVDMAQRADVPMPLLMSVESGKATPTDTYELSAAMSVKCRFLFSPAELVVLDGVAQTSVGLRDIRKLAGLTQRALADKLGVTQASVSIWESGGSPTPSDRVKEAINIAASILGIPVTEVIQSAQRQAGTNRSARITVAPSALVDGTAIIHTKVSVGVRVVVGGRCVLLRGCSIRRDSVLGERVTVGEGARVGRNVTIGDGSQIGAGAIIRSRSNLPPGTQVPPGEIVRIDG